MPEIPVTQDRRPPHLLWLTAAIPFLVLVGFTVQGSVEIRSAPEHTVEVLVDGKPARPFAPGIHRTGLMLIGPHQVTIREAGEPERRKTAYVWLSQRVVVHDGPRSQLEPPAVTTQSEPPRPNTEASTPTAAIKAQSPANTFEGEVLELRLFNVDDAAAATINGTQVLSAQYRHDTGFVNLTDRCNLGANQIGFQLDNLGSGYTWGFEISVDGQIVWHQVEGLVGGRGARGNDQRLGRVFEETVTFVRKASGQTLASSDRTTLDGSEAQLNKAGSESDEFGWEEQEVTVSARAPNGTTTRPLAPNTAYELEVSGTWDAWGDTHHAVDAVECFAQPRCNEARKRKLYQSLRVDGQGLIDLSGGTLGYDDAHVYRVRVLGQGRPLTLVIGDAVSSGGDNRGSLAVRISKAGVERGSAQERTIESDMSAPTHEARAVRVDGNDLVLEFETADTGLLRCVLPSGQIAWTPRALLVGATDLRTVYVVELKPNDRLYYFFLAGAQIATVTVPACSGVVLLLPVGTVDIRTPGIGFGKHGGPGSLKVPHPLAGMERGPDGREYGRVLSHRWTGKRCSEHIPG